MTNQSLTELMNNRYPCGTILGKSDKLDLSMTVAEAKGFLIGLNYVGLISETQLNEWIDLLSTTVVLWGAKHV